MSHLYSRHAVQEEVIHSNQVPLSEFVDHFDTFANRSFPSHWHHELEIQLIISGRAKYHINGVDYTVGEGSAIYIAPETVHMMQGEVPGTVGYDIVLLPQFLVHLLQEIHCDKHALPLTERRPDAFVITPDRKESHGILEAMRKMYYMENSYPAYDIFLVEQFLGIWRNLLSLFPASRQGGARCRRESPRPTHEGHAQLHLGALYPAYHHPGYCCLCQYQQKRMLPLFFRALQNDAH